MRKSSMIIIITFTITALFILPVINRHGEGLWGGKGPGIKIIKTFRRLGPPVGSAHALSSQ